jgi:hypothetical protein
MVVVVKKPVPKYELGDPLWVKVGSYPHWPAQVCAKKSTRKGREERGERAVSMNKES